MHIESCIAELKQLFLLIVGLSWENNLNLILEKNHDNNLLLKIIRWMVELGKIDICLEVSIIILHLGFPKKHDLDQVCHMLRYLKKWHGE